MFHMNYKLTQETPTFFQRCNCGVFNLIRQHQMNGHVRQLSGNSAVNHKIQHLQNARCVAFFLRLIVEQVRFDLFDLLCDCSNRLILCYGLQNRMRFYHR